MATQGVRHLPIVQDGVVVGILSARDVMTQQLLEDRAAAEEVAVLSKCLQSSDLQEAAEIVAAEAPKLFEAKSCVLCLYPENDPGKAPEIVTSNRCLCFDGNCPNPESAARIPLGGGFFEELPAECTEQGGQPPRLVLPLSIAGLRSTEHRAQTPHRLPVHVRPGTVLQPTGSSPPTKPGWRARSSSPI
jgi:hypothetical protein